MTSANVTVVLFTLLIVCSASQAPKQPQVLRCLCPKVSSGGRIPYRDVRSVWHLTPRPHCAKTEVIIRLKNGRQLCLDPNHDAVKMLVERSIKRVYENKHSKDPGSTTQPM
ncbi:hypothetical protein DPEC_G00099450 [Dallia pectoralis]|uniref:Uncharacterized protein n=1 Tax=Dallia pectoralis TaxID=75939 RepID=A0ACC2GX19_DALPE|nr:hypothetical protein DPEC_G00099450 [Dallia pectoralis]